MTAPAPARRAAFAAGAGALGLALVAVATLAQRAALAPWTCLLVFSFAVFYACKAATLAGSLRRRAPRSAARVPAYLLLWPGMDADAFLRRPAPHVPSNAEWGMAWLKTAFGVALVWGLHPRLPADDFVLRGVVGLVGLGYLVFLGAFHLASLLWRQCGIDARPLFRTPVAARSLGEFWGERWNRGFRDLAHRFVFRPLRRRIGAGGAALGAFAASGLIHDLAISVPAGAGFGLCTAYFLVQAAGLAWERRAARRRSRLRTVAVVLLPAGLLFHPPFLRDVLPGWLRLMGAG